MPRRQISPPGHRPLRRASSSAPGRRPTVGKRRDTYQRQRDRVLQLVDAVYEGTFYVWIELPPGLTTATLLTEHRLALA
jgi:hypothetical protein